MPRFALGSHPDKFTAWRYQANQGSFLAMLVAAAWYESNLAIGLSGMAASVVVGIITIWVTIYAARARRTLTFRLKSARPVTANDSVLLQAAADELLRPQVLVIRLHGSGLRDIASDAFDAGEPLTIGTDGEIVKLLKEVSSHPYRYSPKTRVEDGKLKIGPGLIGSKQTLTYTVLVDAFLPTDSNKESDELDRQTHPWAYPEGPETAEVSRFSRRMRKITVSFGDSRPFRISVRDSLIDTRTEHRAPPLLTAALFLTAFAFAAFLDHFLMPLFRNRPYLRLTAGIMGYIPIPLIVGAIIAAIGITVIIWVFPRYRR